MPVSINDVLNYQIADRMPLFNLWRAVWRYVYDKKNCPLLFYKELEKEILKWNAIVQYQKKIKFERFGKQEGDNKPVGLKGDFVDEIEFQIGRMCQVLRWDETNEWHGEDTARPFSKYTVERHKLDYHKLPMCVMFFPEFQDKEGYKRGQEALEQNKKDNPQDYEEKK